MAKRIPKISERETIFNSWEETNEDMDLDVKRFKHLLFETYYYFRKNVGNDSVLLKDLPIYRNIVLFTAWEDYPQSCTQYEFECCTDYALGICYAIENGFDTGYNEVSLPLGLRGHFHGGAEPEADMSSYESFDRCFREGMTEYMENNLEIEELDKEEELKRIADLKDSYELAGDYLV